MRAPLRVAVTRDEADDGPLSRALRRHGHAVVHCPAVFEAPAPDDGALARAAGDLERYDWLVASSARAVEAVMRARGDGPLPGGLRTAAVGDRTAALLVRWGATAPVVAPAPGAVALIETLAGLDAWAGRRVLVPRAAEGGREIADGLRALGASVEEIVAYRTLPRPADEIASAWRTTMPEACVVASPSAARALVGALGTRMLAAVDVVAIGPTTAEALASLGVRAILASHADFESAAGALDANPSEARPS